MPTEADQFAELVQNTTAEALRLLQSNDWAEASALIVQLIQLDEAKLQSIEPRATQSLVEVANTLITGSVFPSAQLLLEKVVRVLSTHPRAPRVLLVVPLHNLAVVHAQLGNANGHAQATHAIGTLAEQLNEPLDSGTVQVFLELGTALEQQGSLNGAVVLFAQVTRYMLTLAETHADGVARWLVRYASILHAAGRHDAAMHHCMQAIALHDANPAVEDKRRIEALGLLGAVALAASNAAAAEAPLLRAVEIAERALRESSDDQALLTVAAAAFHNLASVYITLQRSSRYARAEELMQRALEHLLYAGGRDTSEHALTVGKLANLAGLQGNWLRAAERYTQCIEIFERAPDASPADYSDYLTDFGLLRLRGGAAEDAMPLFRRVCALRDGASESASRRADARSNLATALFETGQLAEAAATFSSALELRLPV